jgi:hypothetical protein
MDPLLRRYLIRSYYFAEALAFYELYYSPLVRSYEPARRELNDPGRQADRPPTWVPLIFHCTTMDQVEAIFASGRIDVGRRGAVSFTEIPLGELDRMKYRHRGAEQVAIGFPRRAIEALGLSPVLYLKHTPGLRQVIRSLRQTNPTSFDTLAPFIDDTDDVAPFFEVRTTLPVSIEEAVWLLTTRRNADSGRPEITGLADYRDKFGRISVSYWHRSHQLGMLGEPQFTSVQRTAGTLTDFTFIGQHYWEQEVIRERELTVRLPAHDKELRFAISDPEEHGRYTGPWRFIDVARRLASLVLGETGESVDAIFPHRLIRNVDAI